MNLVTREGCHPPGSGRAARAQRARGVTRCLVLATMAVSHSSLAQAAGVEVSVFAGQALPTYEQRVGIDLPSVPSFPGLTASPPDVLVLEASGGAAFGAAVALELVGPLAIEARADLAQIDISTDGVTYQLEQSLPPPLPSIRGALSVGAGTVSFDRHTTGSLNLRLQTPGALSLRVSGGLSYLRDPEAGGSLPVRLDIGGLPALPGITAQIGLVGTPSESEHRFGLNAGVGLRLQLGDNLALLGDLRVFTFREYEFRFEVTTEPSIPGLGELIAGLDTVRVSPTHFNGVLGLSLSF